jgi:hypothetical protein
LPWYAGDWTRFPRARPGGVAGRAYGSAQKRRIFFCFLKLLFNAKTIPENPRKCFKAQKNTQKITKIPEKFPKIGWSMNNPSKVFGAHEKDFKAFY